MSVFFFRQKTAYEMRISDWSSDVCSSDLAGLHRLRQRLPRQPARGAVADAGDLDRLLAGRQLRQRAGVANLDLFGLGRGRAQHVRDVLGDLVAGDRQARSEEHTSELQSLMRTSYAVFCLKNKNYIYKTTTTLPPY